MSFLSSTFPPEAAPSKPTSQTIPTPFAAPKCMPTMRAESKKPLGSTGPVPTPLNSIPSHEHLERLLLELRLQPFLRLRWDLEALLLIVSSHHQPPPTPSKSLDRVTHLGRVQNRLYRLEQIHSLLVILLLRIQRALDQDLNIPELREVEVPLPL